MNYKAISPQQIKKLLSALKAVLKDEKGQITLLGLLFSMILLSYALFVILKCQKTSQEISSRLQTYQCFHYLDVETNNYIYYMGNLNKIILAASLMALIPLTSAQGKALQQATIISQQVLHYTHLKKLTSNEYCKLAQGGTYLKNLPYKTRAGIFLERGFDGTTILSNKDFKVWVPNATKSGGYFAIEGLYKIKDKLSSKNTLKTKEVKLF